MSQTSVDTLGTLRVRNPDRDTAWQSAFIALHNLDLNLHMGNVRLADDVATHEEHEVGDCCVLPKRLEELQGSLKDTDIMLAAKDVRVQLHILYGRHGTCGRHSYILEHIAGAAKGRSR